MAIKFTKRNEKYKCFSNFYPVKITYNGITYQSSEAAWQAQKCIDDSDKLKFADTTPLQSKRLGKTVRLRPDWENVKYGLMVDICMIKFQNPQLKEILLSTGNETLIEDTTGWHDNIWGNCDCPRCTNIEGRNLLGKALMQVRKNVNYSDLQKSE
jgi:hypothetical protein